MSAKNEVDENMVETGILNRDIAAELAKLGHTDRVLIADAGLPYPILPKLLMFLLT